MVCWLVMVLAVRWLLLFACLYCAIYGLFVGCYWLFVLW